MDFSSESRPVRVKNLKIIDHMGTCYAYLGSDKVWKIERWMERLIHMCDGKKTTDDIAAEIAKISGSAKEDVMIGLRPILEDLKKNGMIVLE